MTTCLQSALTASERNETGRGVSVVVPDNWSRTDGSAFTRIVDFLGSREPIEVLLSLEADGGAIVATSFRISLIQEQFSIDKIEASGTAEILDAYKATAIKIGQLRSEVRQIGNNRGYFVEYTAMYPNVERPVKHITFTIPGPTDWTVMATAVCLDVEFARRGKDLDGILGSLTIDWAEVARKPSPHRGPWFGVAFGFLLGSIYWLLAMRAKRKKSRPNTE
jgi:hypothetical protein